MIMSSGNNSNNFFKCFLYDKQKKFELFEAKKKCLIMNIHRVDIQTH